MCINLLGVDLDGSSGVKTTTHKVWVTDHKQTTGSSGDTEKAHTQTRTHKHTHKDSHLTRTHVGVISFPPESAPPPPKRPHVDQAAGHVRSRRSRPPLSVRFDLCATQPDLTSLEPRRPRPQRVRHVLCRWASHQTRFLFILTNKATEQPLTRTPRVTHPV